MLECPNLHILSFQSCFFMNVHILSSRVPKIYPYPYISRGGSRPPRTPQTRPPQGRRPLGGLSPPRNVWVWVSWGPLISFQSCAPCPAPSVGLRPGALARGSADLMVSLAPRLAPKTQSQIPRARCPVSSAVMAEQSQSTQVNEVRRSDDNRVEQWVSQQ